MNAAVWTVTQESATLSDAHGVTFPCQRSAEEHLITLGDPFITQLTSSCLAHFEPHRSCFSYLLLCFKHNHFFREQHWDFPSYYAHQWIPVAQWLAKELRSSPFMSATGRICLALFYSCFLFLYLFFNTLLITFRFLGKLYAVG